MDYYDKLVLALQNYFHSSSWKNKFLYGGCYWFANKVQKNNPASVLFFNEKKQHCAVYMHGGLYDVTGRISPNGYHLANDDDIKYMKKKFVPDFELDKLETYLDECKIS